MDSSTVRDKARQVAGPGVRRLRREWQWRRVGADLKLELGPPASYPHLAATHTTPLYRTLSGLDDDLQRGKVTNLRLAVAAIDGLALDPGKRFSFWYHVRKPSRRRGFVDGLVLNQGRLTAGVGGGLCQLTNLIYWMTLHTPLTVVERWRHSYDVFPDSRRTQPFGSGATCAYPVLDLQIENRTTNRFRLGLQVTETDLVGRWTADAAMAARYEVYEADHVMSNEGPGVFVRHNLLRRRVFALHGEVIGDELVAENHALMRYQPFLPGREDATA